MRIPITHLKLLTLFLFLPFLAWAQTTVSGKISDEKGEGIPFATIIEEGTSTGTTTDIDGNFEFNVSKLPTILAVSYIGYKTKKETVTSAGNIAIILMQDNFGLDEIVVTGQGTKPRTILDSPVPVDNFGVKELTTSGKPTLDKMLMFKVPSFNSSNQAISDATAHYDPADLRGLGPSRTLVLINGKRKNQSAQVYLNRTPGKGEVGVDLKSIPTAAIERVEVLRDGASAQYGSDAIGGVINMILKKNVEYTTVTATTGITSKGDGFTVGADLNTAFDFGDGGYVNLTLGYYKQDITNRAGTPGLADLPGAPQEDGFEDTVDDNGNVTTANQNYNDALDVYDTNMITWTKWATENPDLGMHVGQPAMEKVDIFVNMSHPLGEYGEFYTFHGFTTRTGQSFAYYRAPYWRNDVAEAGFLTKPEDFVGYQPTFEAKINDHINVMGVKYDLGGNWNADVSATYGANSVNYTVNNSVNRDYLADNGTSPTTFGPGGYRLQNAIGNLSVSGPLVENINVSTGLEYKKEYFDAFQGDPFSYYKGGSDSFAGVKPAEAGSWDRNNFAAFALIDYDITDALLFGAAARYEDYSDFGDNFSFKVNGRYKLGENGAIRGSYSTGFRAPTLHQRYLTNSQYIIIAGISEPFLQGTLANDNPAVQALGVKSLFAETSRNLSAGVTYRFSNNFYGSVDFYQIAVDDRVLLSSQIGSDSDDDTTNPVEQILDNNNVKALQFFINAGNTTTTGADIVLNYKNYSGFGASFAANFNKTTLDAITTPDALAQNGYSIFAREEKALIEDARPKYKLILGLTYDLEKWNIGLNNTVFGPVTVRHPEGRPQGIDQELSAKLLTDLILTYNFTDRLSLTGVVNNLFDVYPDLTDPNTFTSEAGARFPYSSEVQQQGQLGANFRLGLNYQF